MTRQRKPKAVADEEIFAVLEGRQSPELREFLALIRNVNPTRRDLTPTLRDARYRLKARLQSLLLRRYWEALDLFPGPNPGILGIRRRGERGDACHVRVDLLDGDVRIKVRSTLNQKGRSPRPGTRPAPASPESEDPPSTDLTDMPLGKP